MARADKVNVRKVHGDADFRCTSYRHDGSMYEVVCEQVCTITHIPTQSCNSQQHGVRSTYLTASKHRPAEVCRAVDPSSR